MTVVSWVSCRPASRVRRPPHWAEHGSPRHKASLGDRCLSAPGLSFLFFPRSRLHPTFATKHSQGLSLTALVLLCDAGVLTLSLPS